MTQPAAPSLPSPPESGGSENLPLVSVVIPMCNEEARIGECLQSILDQDYPAGRMEILVVDGGSRDGSVGRVQSLQARHANLRLLHNGSIPSSLNLGLREARGDLYLRMDSHSTMEPDYVRACVEALAGSAADNVGGRMRPVGRTPQGKAIALATSSRFGVGGGRFHYSELEEYVDTVYLGCYRIETLRSLGGYDESMVSEDDELNFRLTKAGGKILLSPRIRSWYVCRGSFRSLSKQYFRYGMWKVRLGQKHGGLPSVRHLIPAAWIASLAAFLGLWGWTPLGGWLLLAALGSYLVVNAGVSALIVFRNGWAAHAMLVPLAFLVLHGAYGTGFLVGVLRFLVLRRS